jgi:hypothetical protein
MINTIEFRFWSIQDSPLIVDRRLSYDNGVMGFNNRKNLPQRTQRTQRERGKIEKMSFDMMFERVISHDDFRKVIGGVFDVPPEQVEIVHSQEYPDYLKVKEDALVLCWLSDIPGDFPLRTEIMPWRKELLHLATDEMECLICEGLSCRALVDGGELSPYRWDLISERGHRQRVTINEDLFDREEWGLVIISYDEEPPHSETE